MNKESVRTPRGWKFLTLIEETRGKFSLCFPYTYNSVTPEILKLARLPEATVTRNLPLVDAIAIGEQLERWNELQTPKRKKG